MRVLVLLLCFYAIVAMPAGTEECSDIVGRIEVLIKQLKEDCIESEPLRKEPEFRHRIDDDDDDIVGMVADIFGVKPEVFTTTQQTTILGESSDDIGLRQLDDSIIDMTSADSTTTTEHMLSTINEETTTDDITMITDYPETTMTTGGTDKGETATIIYTTTEHSTENMTGKVESTTNVTGNPLAVSELLGLRQDLGDDESGVTESAGSNNQKPTNLLDVLTGMMSGIEDGSSSSREDCKNLDEYYIPVLKICGKTRKKSSQKLKLMFAKK